MFTNYLKNNFKYFKFNHQNLKISGLSSVGISAFCAEIFSYLQTDSSLPQKLLYIVDDNIDTTYIKKEMEFFSSGINENIVVINNSLLLEPALSLKSLQEAAFLIKPKEIFNRENLIRKFVDFGLVRVDEVSEKGDFSVRGEIIDLWQEDLEFPVRFIFDNDEVEAIYSFDITTQRRKDEISEILIKDFNRENYDSIRADHFPKTEYLLVFSRQYLKNTEDLFKEHFGVEIVPFAQKDVFDAKVYPMHNFNGVFELFLKQVKEFLEDGYSIKIVLHKESEIKNIKQAVFARLGEKEKLEYCIGTLRQGFYCHPERLAVFTEKDIFDRDIVAETGGEISTKNVFDDSLVDYKIGDLVVHANYGIGKFLGFHKIKSDEKISEYITIEYSKNDKLYVPFSDFNLIHKYANYDTNYKINLDSLDGISWAKTRKRVEQKIFEMADEIIGIQAKRKQVKGIAFPENLVLEEEFKETFPYTETDDQKTSIEEILFDMTQSSPMERLLCGDVGYGKTEVAIRAVFRAVINGYQVAIVVPTTILAKQHFNTFRKRFANYPVNIEMLSRFSSQKQRNLIKEKLKIGGVDVVIATHSVLRSTIDFKNLGLVIIDEEHRFGVKDKEKLKRLNENIDILYMSATPIPRTLSMALNGVKDISVIETPPPNRKEISTHIGRYDEVMIKEAINFELKRQGQVFYIYNHIEDIQIKFRELTKLAPSAKIAVAHGQMENNELDDVMTRFFNKEIDILLATTIVESGLDIPAMNMMIIDGVERMGLAQIYQLRGRVGRGYEKAFCYLFYSENISLKENAVKRLQAVQSFQGFGAGFKLALRDLEIRGAGNILGKKQHGYIKEVGFEMYLEMLNRAMDNMKSGKKSFVNTEIDLNVNAYLPDSYIQNSAIRLYFYKRLLNLNSLQELGEIKDEMTDRYGREPSSAQNLLVLTEIRIISKILVLKSIKEIRDKIIVEFADVESVNLDKLLDISKEYYNNIKFKPEKLNGFEILDLPDKKEDKILFVKNVLQKLF